MFIIIFSKQFGKENLNFLSINKRINIFNFIMSKIYHGKVKSKIYADPNELSITLNKDHSHQRLVAGKSEEAKYVKQRKQIEKMMQFIIKERMFGNFLAENTRISNSGYQTLQAISRTSVNPSRRRSIRNSNMNKDIKQSRFQSITEGSVTPAIGNHYQSLAPIQGHKRAISLTRQFKRSPKQPRKIHIPESKSKIISSVKVLSLAKFPDFKKFFQNLSGNSQAKFYDIKITKQLLLKRCEQIMDSKLLERLFYFFNFPSCMSYRQYCGIVENVVNCPLNDIHFFTYRLLDESKNGFITISDLFQILQYYKDDPYIEAEIYKISEKIDKINKQLKQAQSSLIKPTVAEVLVTNHNLKLQQVRQLLKQQDSELNSLSYVKSTCYHQSVLALQHDINYRLKQHQIQSSAVQNQQKKKQNKKVKLLNQDGMRLRDYMDLFQGKRPRMFCLFIKVLTGLNPADFQ